VDHCAHHHPVQLRRLERQWLRMRQQLLLQQRQQLRLQQRLLLRTDGPGAEGIPPPRPLFMIRQEP